MRCVLPLIALLSLAFAPIPFPKPDQSRYDLKRMQGRWRMTVHKWGENGSIKEYGLQTGLVEITSDRLRGFLNYRSWEIVLDAKTSPKCIDLIIREAGKVRRVRGIYTIVDDTFTFQWSEVGERPISFLKLALGECLLGFKRTKE